VFLQAPEGEPREVVETFDRITTDTRHKDVTTLERGLYANQLFPN
jgi:hypothetical protein